MLDPNWFDQLIYEILDEAQRVYGQEAEVRFTQQIGHLSRRRRALDVAIVTTDPTSRTDTVTVKSWQIATTGDPLLQHVLDDLHQMP